MLKKLKLALGNVAVRFVKWIAKKAKIDLIRVAYSENGISKSYSLEASGELFFINHFLRNKLQDPQPVFFDVGGNKGEYSQLLKRYFPDSIIHTFEPNPHTFKLLKQNAASDQILVNQGIGAETGELNLYFDARNTTSVQATSDPQILAKIAQTTNVVSEKIGIITLDSYCEANGINHIDLLKIDTEGFELEALQGAKQLLRLGAIDIIQFEFNEVNIVKRRFLTDFYDLLVDFDFFRLDEKRLIPLGKWQPIHEIFLFQNIVAILKK